MTDFTNRKIKNIVVAELESLQNSGYFVPENADYEVATGIHIAASTITRKIMDALEARQYVRIDGKFYAKKAIQQIKPIER